MRKVEDSKYNEISYVSEIPTSNGSFNYHGVSEGFL